MPKIRTSDFNSRIGEGTVGGLMGAKAGVGIKKASLFLQLDVAKLNADKFSQQYNDTPLLFLSFGIGGQYHFPLQNSSLAPYLEAGMNLQYFSPPSDDKQNWLGYSGYGPSFGGGAKYFLSDTFSLDIAFISSYGTYNHTYTNRSGNEMEVNSFNLQLNAGFSWYPF